MIEIIRQENDLKAHKVEFVLMPQAWRTFVHEQFPCAWRTIKLDESGKSDPVLTKRAGIYTLLLQPDIARHPACSYLMYVGQTHNLRQRFHNYSVTEKKRRKRPNVYRMLNMYDGFIWFCFTEVDEARLTEYENALMSAFVPPVNDKNRLPADVRSTRGAF